jgi:hypothetical protein
LCQLLAQAFQCIDPCRPKIRRQKLAAHYRPNEY